MLTLHHSLVMLCIDEILFLHKKKKKENQDKRETYFSIAKKSTSDQFEKSFLITSSTSRQTGYVDRLRDISRKISKGRSCTLTPPPPHAIL